MRGFFLASMFVFFLYAPCVMAASPEIVEIESPGGLKAWFLENRRLPLVTLSFAFKGGVERDPVEKQGLASLTSSLLTQGAGPYDEQAFQEKLAALSVQMSVQAGRDALTGELKTLRRTKDEAFRLLGLALSKPRFDQDVFERARNQQLVATRFQIAKPGWQGRYALFQRLFGAHPYGYRSLGSPASLNAINRNDVSVFARQRLAKDNLFIVIVGDLSAKEAALALDKIFGALPDKAGGAEPALANLSARTQTILVRREGTQTNILFAAPMLPRKDGSWAAAEVANYILGGGGFVSRLTRELREKEGLTYGVSTNLASMEKASLLLGELAADNDKAAKAVSRLKEVWGNLYENGVQEEEVQAAKDYLTGSLPLALSSTDAAASVLLGIQLDGFDKDYLARFGDEVRAVKKEAVSGVVRRWFNPDALCFAFVGAPEGLDADEIAPLVKE